MTSNQLLFLWVGCFFILLSGVLVEFFLVPPEHEHVIKMTQIIERELLLKKMREDSTQRELLLEKMRGDSTQRELLLEKMRQTAKEDNDWWAFITTSAVSAISTLVGGFGTIIASLLLWRKGKQETAAMALENQMKALEIEKLRRELDAKNPPENEAE